MYISQVSGECLQDHWSSGSDLNCQIMEVENIKHGINCDFVCCINKDFIAPYLLDQNDLKSLG